MAAKLDIAVTATNQASATLNTVGKDLDQVSGSAKKADSAITGVGDAGGNAERGLQGLADTAGFLGEQLGLPIGPAAEMAGTFAQLGGGIEALAQGFPGLIKQMGPLLARIGAQITATWAYVTALYAQAAAFIVANAPIIAIIAGLALLGAAIFLVIDNWGAIVSFVQGPVVNAFNAVKSAMSAVLDWMRANWPLIAAIIAGPFAPLVLLATDAFGIRSALIGAFQAVVAALPGIWSAISGIITAPFEAVVGGAGDLWGVKSAVEGAFSAALGFVRSNWPEIATIISGPFAPLVALATDAFGVRSALEGAFTAAASFISGKVGEIVGFITGIPGKLGNLSNEMYNIGIGMMQGLINGVKGMAQTVANAAVNVVRDAVNAAKDFLGIGSPSKLFAEMGFNIGAGMALGIMQSWGLVEDAAGRLVHLATGTVITAALLKGYLAEAAAEGTAFAATASRILNSGTATYPAGNAPGAIFDPFRTPTPGAKPDEPNVGDSMRIGTGRYVYWTGNGWSEDKYSTGYTGTSRLSTPTLYRPNPQGENIRGGYTVNMTFNGPTNSRDLEAAMNAWLQKQLTVEAMRDGLGAV